MVTLHRQSTLFHGFLVTLAGHAFWRHGSQFEGRARRASGLATRLGTLALLLPMSAWRNTAAVGSSRLAAIALNSEGRDAVFPAGC